MTGDRDDRRAAAICEHCGSCHVVHVRPDGSVRVIGTNGACGCGESDYQILGGNHQPRADAEPAPREPKEI